LPSDIPYPQVRTSRGSSHVLLLSDTLTSSLITMGTSKDVTLFMILLAAFQILLHYYSRQCDIVVGTDVAGRNRAEIEGLIGMFTNEVVMRTNLAGNPTVNELLYRVRKTALDAYEHQDLPIDMLVEALNPERRLGVNPLFQVKLVHNNMPIPEIDLGGLAMEPIYFDDGRIICDLLLETRQMNDRVICKLKYSADLFESYTIKRMLEQYGKLLQSMVTGTDLTLSELVRILEEDDKRQLQIEREQLERTNTHNRKNIKRRPVSGSISSDGAKL